MPDKMFSRLDANGDGVLDKSELAARHGRFEDHEGNEAGKGLFAHLDTNGDGAIDANELQQGAAKRFERLDANHDGSIDKSEMAAHRGFDKHECGEGKQPGSKAGAAGVHG
jgi:Ca2+-binding EF-hand superfamily protein